MTWIFSNNFPNFSNNFFNISFFLTRLPLGVYYYGKFLEFNGNQNAKGPNGQSIRFVAILIVNFQHPAPNFLFLGTFHRSIICLPITHYTTPTPRQAFFQTFSPTNNIVHSLYRSQYTHTAAIHPMNAVLLSSVEDTTFTSFIMRTKLLHYHSPARISETKNEKNNVLSKMRSRVRRKKLGWCWL